MTTSDGKNRRRSIVRKAIAAVAALATISISSEAHAQPVVIGPNTTQTVYPNSDTCTIAEPSIQEKLACATGQANEFFAAEGHDSSPLAEIVSNGMIPNLAFSPATGQFCPNGQLLGPVSCADRVWYPAEWVAGQPTHTLMAIQAHESAHKDQLLAGSDPVLGTAATMFGLASGSSYQPHENQGDCVAGAAIAYYQQNGIITPGQAVEAKELFSSIGSTDDSTHGSPQTREAYVDLGMTEGLASCNNIVPGITPY